MGLLDKEILSIAAGGVDKFYEARVEAIIDTGTYKIYPTAVFSLDVHRNYTSNLSDIIKIDLLIPKGDYIKCIEPVKDNLSILITTFNIGVKDRITYKLVISNSDAMTESKKDTSKSVDELNKDAMVHIKGECISETIGATRLAKTQMIFEKTNVAGVIYSVLGGLMGVFGTLGGLGGRGLQMVPPDNSRVYERIVLKEGLTILDVPTYLQETDYGIYNGGIGTYVQRTAKGETTYVFPIYGNKGNIFNNVLTIIDVTNSMSMDAEFTYGVNGDEVKIIASVFSVNKPADETKAKAKGTGIVAIDSDAVMNRSAEVTPEKIMIKKENYIRGGVNKVLKDGSQEIRAVGVTNNMYKHKSETLLSDGNLVTFKWQNSKADLLMPGMTVTQVMVADDTIKKRTGILHGVDKFIDNASKTETSILFVFMKDDGENK